MTNDGGSEYVIRHGQEHGCYLAAIERTDGVITTTWKPELEKALTWPERKVAETIAEQTHGGEVVEIEAGKGGKRFRGIGSKKSDNSWKETNRRIIYGERSRWSSIRMKLESEARADRLFLRLAETTIS